MLGYFLLLLLVPALLGVDRLAFDTYSEMPISESDRLLDFEKLGVRNMDICIKQVRACDPYEGRRMSETCNNLNYPVSGSARSIYRRVLPPNYGPGNSLTVRPSDGGELPPARLLRTQLLPSAYVDNRRLSIMGMHITGFLMTEVTEIQAVQFPLIEKKYCCTALGALDPECMPMSVPKDDPVYGPLGITCLNATRVRTLQDYGCIDNRYPRMQVNFQTTCIDLSQVYGPSEETANTLRTKRGGLLRMQERHGRLLPPSAGQNCFGNQLDKNEDFCPLFGGFALNFDWRVMTLGAAFYMEHNRLAKLLGRLNPCWDDEKLFRTARKINIAIEQNIIFYGMAPLYFGRERMLEAGLIHETEDHFDDYDENLPPATLLEFTIVMRSLHTLIDGRVEMFSSNGTSEGSVRMTDYIFRIAPLEFGDTLEAVNRGSFLQKASANDMFGDQMVNNDLFGNFHKASDLGAFDFQRGRDFGLPFYNDYREICGLPRARKFSDFLDVIGERAVETLENLYHDVEDVELFAGIISERLMPNAYVGPTHWCITSRQFQILRNADRFWFERPDHPDSFTPEQLREIRKVTISRLACDNFHGINVIQPQGFLNVMPGNEQIPCSYLPALDISHWKDSTCELHDHV